ncbi:MAG: N-acetyltransferase [Candidatus Nomurabacteria bacterium]|nr:N-acetyltransferase [Candidatus Nomurabacteria bacterium]
MNHQEQMNTPQNILETNIRRIIENFQTGEKYEMQGGKDMVFTDEDIKKIAEICSQENKYNLLFKDMLQGKPYTEEDARKFVNWVKEGWDKQSHYVFFLRKPDGDIVGCIDIKGKEGEVGYWADENYSGFMTNAAKELSSIAREGGFEKLFAWVRAINDKSIGVLERAGYEKVLEEEKEGKGLSFQYEKQLK